METKLNHAASSEAILVANPRKTTTILGNFNRDAGPIIVELGYSKTLDFDAKIGGFNLLNTPDYLYRGSDEFWVRYNKPFLDKAIERGDDILLATPLRRRYTHKNDKLTGFGREINYLKSKGYRYDRATNRMIRGD